MVPILSYAQHYKKYYTVQFEGAAAAYGLNQLEIDILLFLHNNPELCTASDICRYRALAKSNVSAAVERLRSRGVLTVSPAAAGLYRRRLHDGCGAGRDPTPQHRAAVCRLHARGTAGLAGLSAPHGCQHPALLTKGVIV